MSSQTTIEWTQATWNPVTGCSKVSPGCAHCYAETFAERWRGVPGHAYEQGFDLRLWPERLELPLRWRKPRLIFVNSMSDLFHPEVPESFVAQVWDTMARAHWHTFQVLTKRPERMPGLLAERGLQDPPLANVWIGTSIENRRFVGRAEHLRRTPAVVRFIRAEPLLGPLRCSRRRWPDGYTGPSLCLTGIDWLIAGGESGPQHRPVRPEWIRDLRDACQRANKAFFFKQWGGARPKSGGRELDGRTRDELPRPQGPGDVSPTTAGALSGSLPSAAQGLDAGQRDGQLSIVPESSPDRAGRPRVRRSRRLGETPATDPSTKIEVLTPPSTGDTSLLEHPQPGVRALVLGSLSASDKRLLLEGGAPRHELSGSSGPLRPEVTLRLREILVSQYTPAAWRSHLAWHTYWDRHGGFGGANLDNEQLMAASPPTPRSDHRKVRVTWGQARKWVREEAADQASAAKAPSDTSRAGAGEPGRRVGVPARTRHDLDRAGQRLRGRFAYCPSRRGPADPKWAWTDAAAQACEASIREVLADATRANIDAGAVQRRSRAALEVAHELLASSETLLPPASATHATRRLGRLPATSGCAWCSGPMPEGLRAEAKFCGKSCRQAASRVRLKAQPARFPSPPPETCAWCSGPMPDGPMVGDPRRGTARSGAGRRAPASNWPSSAPL